MELTELEKRLTPSVRMSIQRGERTRGELLTLVNNRHPTRSGADNGKSLDNILSVLLEGELTTEERDRATYYRYPCTPLPKPKAAQDVSGMVAVVEATQGILTEVAALAEQAQGPATEAPTDEAAAPTETQQPAPRLFLPPAPDAEPSAQIVQTDEAIPDVAWLARHADQFNGALPLPLPVLNSVPLPPGFKRIVVFQHDDGTVCMDVASAKSHAERLARSARTAEFLRLHPGFQGIDPTILDAHDHWLTEEMRAA